ncbi:MAG: ABC transporter permease [Gemmatimonadetes bacterium]|nr:ABC transporter permease [Gemmatimonadota bacterium]
MKFARLVLANLGRNKRRTVLTVLSVALAFFLFATLRSVLTTLDAARELGSESRLIVLNATGLTFPVRQSQIPRLEAMEGVKSVSWANWFGGLYQERPEDFFANFAIDPASYLALYPEVQLPPDQKTTFLAERTAAIVGKGLMEKFGWRLGQTVTLKGTIFPGDWDFVIRGVYTPTDPAYGDQNFFFRYDYLYERSGRRAEPGWFVLQLTDPASAATISARVDTMFKNSPTPTKTETEKAFQAGFVTMWGNVAFLMRAIGTAVFFAILFVAANTMMMAARERIGEIAVLKTLGFPDGTIFGIVIAEAGVMTLLGGAIGLVGARALFGSTHALDAFLPGFRVEGGTLALGFAIAATLGVISGALPAWQAARLSVVQALRKVA